MYQILLAIQCVGIILLFAECVYIFSHWKSYLQGILFFSCVATLVNNTGYLLEMIAPTEESYFAALQMSYLGRVWVPFSLFIFICVLCNLRVKRPIIIGLVTTHVSIFLLVLTSRYHTLYYSSMEYVTDALFPYIHTTHGVIYYCYSALIVLYIFAGLVLLFSHTHRQKDPIAKRRLVYVSVSISVESLFYILSLFKLFGCYDLNNIGYVIASIIMCIAIFRYDLMDTLTIARDYVLDEISEAVFAIDCGNYLSYANKQAKPFLGKEFEFRDFAKRMQVAMEADEPLLIDGKYYSPTIEPLMHHGQFQGTIYILVDDTEHYEYMQKLKEQKEIAEAANASKSAFLSVVSHEIRTPMNAVVGMTELLLAEHENLTDKQEKYLRNIKNSGSSLVMIVNDILDQSKIEAGKMEIVEDTYELRPMLEDVRMIIENRIGTKPIELSCEVSEDIPKLLVGDSLRLRQILINLMNNAVKFTEDGFIILSLSVVAREDDRLQIRFGVKDSGQGIRKEDLSRLGEAFSQVDLKKNHKKEGTGLGLSISKDFISLMGGQLEVSSTYGEGSEFFFTISQGIGEEANEEHQNRLKQAWQEEADICCPDARILVVDDTLINLMVFEEMMKPLKATIDTAGSGPRAIEFIKKNKYDAIFMDYMMPYMDGIETTKHIREAGVTTPIIALSADDSEKTHELFIEAGMDDFTEKPLIIGNIKHILIKWLPENLIQKSNKQ